MHARSAIVPHAALVAGALALGSSPIFARLSELAPTATAFYRVAIAVPALCFLPYVLAGEPAKDGARGFDRRNFLLVTAAGALFAADLAFLHWSLRYTSVANSTLFLNSAPFFVGLFGWIVFQDPLRIRFVSSLMLAFVGVVLLVAGPSVAGTRPAYGNLLALLAGAAYGGYLIVVSRLRRSIATGPIMTISTLAAAICLLPLAIVLHESLLATTRQGWSILIALALITHVAGQGLVAFAFKALPAATSSAVLLLQPVVAALFAWLLFGEALAPSQIVGGAIVLAGVYLCQLAASDTRPVLPARTTQE